MSKKTTLIIVALSVMVLLLSVGVKLNKGSNSLEKGDYNSSSKNLEELKIYNYEKTFDFKYEELPKTEFEINATNGYEAWQEHTSLINFSHNTCAWFIYGPKGGRMNGTLTLLHQFC
jgi:hypothetical protein